jgi:hypothetical protein
MLLLATSGPKRFDPLSREEGQGVHQCLVPKLAVIGVDAVGQVKIDASAAAPRRGQLNQSPLLCPVVVEVFRPGGRGCEPA